MKQFKYTIDGKVYEVELNELSDTTAEVTVNGDKFVVETEQEKEPEKEKVVLGQPSAPADDEPTTSTANVNTANALKAPLPGVIIEIKVKVGDTVKAGDTLVVP